MPINEWQQERSKALKLLRAELANMSSGELEASLKDGSFTDPRKRALAEQELLRRSQVRSETKT